jgi:cellulose synthase/poly-beta-1,6-N-acetylglucosamine synthase-like glycosyltransferase
MLQAKIDNLLALNYPKDRLQIVIASDGSTDGTAQILNANKGVVHPVWLETPQGKAEALNEARNHATGEILVFFDVRQRIALDAVSELTSFFHDPSVGAVSGELLLDASAIGDKQSGLGIYWRLEKLVRKFESVTGSVIGATGAIYAIRAALYREMPRGTILDDVFLPMNVVRNGKRVIFCPSALAYDELSDVRGKEFSRKVRTLTGNYQLLDLQPWLLKGANPMRFRFVNHKLMRLMVPIFLCLMLLASGMEAGIVYRVFFWAQVSFYVAGVVGWIWPFCGRFRLVGLASTFLMLNSAAAVAFYNFLFKRYRVWV